MKISDLQTEQASTFRALGMACATFGRTYWDVQTVWTVECECEMSSKSAFA